MENLRQVPPVLFIIFRRERTTKVVFEAIRKAKPSILYIAADGPRKEKVGELEACERTRAIVETIDWDCQVKKLFRTENVGCHVGITEAITWFLEECGQGIILEDDCVPSQEFFTFAHQMLGKYKNDQRVMHINGSNFHRGKRWTPYSYYFSRYNHGWGWATWNRAWKKMDNSMSQLDSFILNSKETGFWNLNKEAIYWEKILNQAKNSLVDAWDYQWNYSMWVHNGIAITPEANLISNIGFGDDATNTIRETRSTQTLSHENLGNILDPLFPFIHKKADIKNFLQQYWGSPIQRFISRALKVNRLILKRSK